MKLEINGKTLWHIQSITDWHDEPYDTFILSDKEPSQEQLSKLYRAELGLDSDDEVKDLLENANVYTVCAEEIKE
jgi:hypothetical protein